MNTKTALITGASSGIGLELAHIHAQNNHNLVLVARREETLNELKHKLESLYGVDVHVFAKDLTTSEAAEAVFSFTDALNVNIDFLINNAGFGDYGNFVDTDWRKEENMIALNITTLTHLTKLYLPSMIARGYGKIMNVASTASFQPGPKMAVYFATKSYVLHFSEAIHSEVKKKGVTVTALCPGATESGFQSAAEMEESRLVKGRQLPSSKEVAAYGFKAMMKGKPVAIHGYLNKMLAFSTRLFPRSLVTELTKVVQDKA